MYNKWFINGEYTFSCEIFKKQKQKPMLNPFLEKNTIAVRNTRK